MRDRVCSLKLGSGEMTDSRGGTSTRCGSARSRAWIGQLSAACTATARRRRCATSRPTRPGSRSSCAATRTATSASAVGGTWPIGRRGGPHLTGCLLRLMRHRSGFLPVALDSLRKAEAAALEPERQQKHFRNFATLFATREPGVDQGSRSLGDFADRVYTEPTGRLRSTPPGRGSRPCMLCRSGEGVLAAATRRPHCTRPSPRLWQRSEMSRVRHKWLPPPSPPPTPGVRTMKCSAS